MNTIISPSARVFCTKVWAVFTVFSLVFGTGLFINSANAVVSTPLFESSFEPSEGGSGLGLWNESAEGPGGNKWSDTADTHNGGTKAAKVTNDTGATSDELTSDPGDSPIDTTGYEDLSVSFYYRVTETLESDDVFNLYWSIDDSDYHPATPLFSISDVAAGEWIFVPPIVLPDAAENVSTLRIQFSALFDSEPGPDQDEVRIDDVVLSGTEIDAGPTDTDEDGVIDDEDNCPAIDNPGQEDFDGDGVGDVCDNDDDGDGVEDGDDSCPNTPIDVDEVDADGCAIGEDPETGSIQVTKYICTDDTVVVRSLNGVGGAVPETCEPLEGASFGYVHGSATDTGPDDGGNYTELAIAAGGGMTDAQTDEDGVVVFDELSPDGRYLIAETDGDGTQLDSSEIINLYCEGDGDTGDTTYDNQELTFVSAGETSLCVAYNAGLVVEPAMCELHSDSQTTVSGEASVEIAPHPNWTDIDDSDAVWIWNEEVDENGSHPVGPLTLTREFSLDSPVSSVTLEISSDNGYYVEVNGLDASCQDADAYNWNSVDICVLDPNLFVDGNNEITFIVDNYEPEVPGNPAGLIYELNIEGSECGDSLNEFATVNLCKVDENENPLSGWTLMLLGDDVDEFSVPSENSVGTDSVSLSSGVSYVFNALGDWFNAGGNGGTGNTADAEYVTADSWETHTDGPPISPDNLDLQVNESFVDWGMFNAMHSYFMSFVPGSDGSVNFRIFDGSGSTPNESWYNDNEGSLDVSIFEGFSGITGENGCVEFTDVPFGEYEVDEIMQDGWENVSGLGSVVVDEEAESFTVINMEASDEVQCKPEATGEINDSPSADGVEEMVETYKLDESPLGDGDSFELFVLGDASAEGDFDDQVRVERTNEGFKLYFYGNPEGDIKEFSGTFQLNDDVDYSGMDWEVGNQPLETSGSYIDEVSVNQSTGVVSFTLYVSTGHDSFVVKNLSNDCDDDDDEGGGGAEDEENTLALCTDGLDNDGDELIDSADPDCEEFGVVLGAFSCDLGILHQNIVVGDPKTKLFAIDEDTLAVGDVTTSSQDFSNNVAVDASGVIYSVDDDDKILYIVNTDGSDPTPVGTGTGITGRIPAAGFGPDGMLYVIEKIPSGGDQFLHVIDPDTGVATELAELDLEVNGGDLVVNGDMQVIYVHIDGEVWSIDLLDGYDEESLGFLPEDEQYTGLALIDDIYYATVRNEANGLQEFTLDGGFTDNGFSSFADHTVYAGDAASCPVEANDRNSISGWKFYDTENPIGEFAGGDSLLSDWPIRLYEDVLGDDWLFVESQDTDGNGEYSFENLEAKVYYVCELEVVDEGGDWVQTYPTSGDNVVDNDSPNQNEEADNCYRVNLGADEHVVDLYFGNYDGNVEEDNGGGGPVILGSGSSGGSSGGSVAGASTGPGGSVLGAATGPGQCTPWLYDFVNNTTDWKLVLRLQIFLNTFEGENLTLNGVYDEATADAVARFQLKYRTQVLAPWGLSLPTRFVWLTTTNMINSILNPNCRAALPAGPLVPYPGGFPAPETPAAIFSDGTFSPGETSGWAN